MANRGFTLIELMIVTAVIGILAMIAFPSYNQYVLRSNRTVGKTVLMKLAGQQESFFSDRKTYAPTLAALNGSYGDPSYAKRDSNIANVETGDAIYRIDLTPTANGFLLTATAINAQAKDAKCTTLTFDSSGQKGATGTDLTNCWK
jgi:type IV pilus assembly protein PilE